MTESKPVVVSLFASILDYQLGGLQEVIQARLLP